MSSTVSREMIPAIRTFKMLSDTDMFLHWLKKTHNGRLSMEQVFPGYRFALQCCLNAFISALTDNDELEVERDFLLQRASAENKPIHQIDGSCEKTILLKNLKPLAKGVLKARDFERLTEASLKFWKTVGEPFEQQVSSRLTLDGLPNMEQTVAENLLLIDFYHTYLAQIKVGGPIANAWNPISTDAPTEWLLQEALPGYLIALQFLGSILFSDQHYRAAQLDRLHTATTWKDYIYETNHGEDAECSPFMETFILDRQTCLDSYFFRIKEHITDELGQKIGFPVYSIDSHFKLDWQGYNKYLAFGDLLKLKPANEKVQLSMEEQVEQTLLWYPIDVIDAENGAMQAGVPSFNTTLAGAVYLQNDEQSSFDQIVVARFKHPLSNGHEGADYSYGILIDSKPAAGHYYNGWNLYLNACGDYSGFSGSEHRAAEKLIARFVSEGKVLLRPELNISLEKFCKVLDKTAHSGESVGLRVRNQELERRLQKARSYAFELLVYRAHVRYYANTPGARVEFNIGQKSTEGEADVVITSPGFTLLVECKLNPNNVTALQNEIDHWRRKVQEHQRASGSQTVELWSWHEPSVKTKGILETADIRCVIVRPGKSSHPVLKGVDLSRLEAIMNTIE